MTTIDKPAAAETQSPGVECAEDMQSPGVECTEDKAAPKSRTRKTAEEPPIDDLLFFAKLNLMSKKIAQDARRCRLASLPIV